MIYAICSASRSDGGDTPGLAFCFGRRWRRAGTRMAVGGCSRHCLNRGARSELANPLGHYPVPRGQPRVDHPVIAEAVVGNDLPGLRLVAGGDHVNGLQSLELLNGLLRNADRARIFECSDDDTHEQAWAQDAIGIGYRDAHLQRPALLIDCRVDEVELPWERIVAAVGKPDMKWRCQIGPLSRRAFQCLLQLQESILAEAEVHPHRVARVERRE